MGLVNLGYYGFGPYFDVGRVYGLHLWSMIGGYFPYLLRVNPLSTLYITHSISHVLKDWGSLYPLELSWRSWSVKNNAFLNCVLRCTRVCQLVIIYSNLEMNILYRIFYVSFYTLTTIYHMLNCEWFVSVLNLIYFIRK